MTCLGNRGTMVPAVTTSPSSNFKRAKSLASASVAKVRVDRGRLRLSINVCFLGTSNVTYQMWFMHCRPNGRSARPASDVAPEYVALEWLMADLYPSDCARTSVPDDLESLGLQFEDDRLGQMRAFLRLDP